MLLPTSAPLMIEVLVLGPSLHGVRSFFGNTFLHLIHGHTDPSLNVVYNFDASLPFGSYDLRQLFTGAYPVELHRQTWGEFYELELVGRRRSLQRISITSTASKRAEVMRLLSDFPRIEGFPTHYAALSANCSTLALEFLGQVGLSTRQRAPFIPLLVPQFLRRQSKLLLAT